MSDDVETLRPRPSFSFSHDCVYCMTVTATAAAIQSHLNLCARLSSLVVVCGLLFQQTSALSLLALISSRHQTREREQAPADQIRSFLVLLLLQSQRQRAKPDLIPVMTVCLCLSLSLYFSLWLFVSAFFRVSLLSCARAPSLTSSCQLLVVGA